MRSKTEHQGITILPVQGIPCRKGLTQKPASVKVNDGGGCQKAVKPVKHTTVSGNY